MHKLRRLVASDSQGFGASVSVAEGLRGPSASEGLPLREAKPARWIGWIEPLENFIQKLQPFRAGALLETEMKREVSNQRDSTRPVLQINPANPTCKAFCDVAHHTLSRPASDSRRKGATKNPS